MQASIGVAQLDNIKYLLDVRKKLLVSMIKYLKQKISYAFA